MHRQQPSAAHPVVRRSLKGILQRAAASPVVWHATRRLRERGWLALTYHRIGAPDEPFRHVPAAVFRRQLEWLRENCDIIDPRTLPQRSVSLRPDRPAVLITFDDGYRDFKDLAYPVLRDLGIPVVNFLPTRYIDESGAFWWDILDTAVRHTTRARAVVPGAGGREITLDGEGRAAFARECKMVLKRSAAPARSPVFEEALATLGWTRETVPLERQVMTWDEVRAVADLTTFGGHTHTHPIMPLVEAHVLLDEIATGRDRIAAETGAAPQLFAYPSGACDANAQAAVTRSGFSVAFTTVEALNRVSTDWLGLNRVHAPATLDEFVWTVRGWRV